MSDDSYRNSASNAYGGGETRQRFFAAKVLPHSFADENKMLLKRLEMYKENSMQQ